MKMLLVIGAIYINVSQPKKKCFWYMANFTFFVFTNLILQKDKDTFNVLFWKI